MKERPILFSGPMVKAILDGRKTQTRRIVKPPAWSTIEEIDLFAGMPYVPDDNYESLFIKCPYGEQGERGGRLWVRETWGIDPYHFMQGHDKILYRATFDGDPDYPVRWRPSIHMFRKYSRITLEITNIGVERLQDIGQGDACAEGCPQLHEPIDWFMALWDLINGKKYPWLSNPWVWKISFKKL